MLSINDYNHLKLLYQQLENTNLHLKELINENNWDSIENLVRDKEKLLKKIMQFEKSRIDSIKENTELLNIRKKIVELEKENIESIISIKNNMLKEINQVQKNRKILNAYEPSTLKTFSTLDIKTED